MAGRDDIERELRDIDAAHLGEGSRLRDAASLHAVVARLRAAAPKAAAGGETLLESAVALRLTFYEALVEVARGVRDAEYFGPMESRSTALVFERHARHLSRQPAATRDRGFLLELSRTLTEIRERRLVVVRGADLPQVHTLSGEHALTRSSAGAQFVAYARSEVAFLGHAIARYDAEIAGVERARSEGTEHTRVGHYAEAANWQMALYTRYFAGRARLTRSPDLLARIVAELRDLRAAMATLRDAGHASATNDRNIEIIGGRLDAYEPELAAIRSAQGALEPRALAAELAAEAEALYAEHRADAPARSLERSWFRIDALDELRRRLERLARLEDDAEIVAAALTARSAQARWVEEYGLGATVPHRPSPSTASLVTWTVLPPLVAVPAPELVRHRSYTRDEAVAAFGGVDGAVVACDGALLLAPRAIACAVTATRGSGGSCFASPSSFRWRIRTSDYRGELRNDAPVWADAPPSDPLPTHLFVRLPGDDAYFYAGPVTLTGHRSEGNTQVAELGLEQKIPREAWLRFGGAAWSIEVNHARHTLASGAVDALERLLAALGARTFGHLRMTRYEEDALTLHTNAERGWLAYEPRACEPGRHACDAEAAPGYESFECACGIELEVPRRDTIPRERAVAAAVSFFRTETPPECCSVAD
ncbi:MAG: hypothetical protein HY908_35140 [Myxococcales bacterium]|nr:hypothetical protein [Myxococcales bacterium]